MVVIFVHFDWLTRTVRTEGDKVIKWVKVDSTDGVAVTQLRVDRYLISYDYTEIQWYIQRNVYMHSGYHLMLQFQTISYHGTNQRIELPDSEFQTYACPSSLPAKMKVPQGVIQLRTNSRKFNAPMYLRMVESLVVTDKLRNC